MENWNYINEVGNPTEEGAYDVILIYEDVVRKEGTNGFEDEDFERTGKRYAVQESRWFGPVTVNDGWVMKDQPKEGLAWHEESGSYFSETVWAWYPKREFPKAVLPEGVYWE